MSGGQNFEHDESCRCYSCSFTAKENCGDIMRERCDATNKSYKNICIKSLSHKDEHEASDGTKWPINPAPKKADVEACNRATDEEFEALTGSSLNWGPPAMKEARRARAREVELERELAKSNYWRERWCNESQLLAARSQENWQRAKDLEAQLAAALQRAGEATKENERLREYLRVVSDSPWAGRDGYALALINAREALGMTDEIGAELLAAMQKDGVLMLREVVREFRKYGRHTRDCPADNLDAIIDKCSCGFDTLMKNNLL